MPSARCQQVTAEKAFLMDGTYQSWIPLVLVPLSWYLVQGNSESDEYGSRSQDMMAMGLTRCHQVTTRLAQACQPLVYNRAGGRDTNLIKIISPQQNTSYTSMEVLEPPVIILRKRTQYSSSWKSLIIQREMIWTLAKDRHWRDGTAIMACKDWRLMRRALNAARDSIKPIWSAALQRRGKENKRRHSKRNDSAGL